MHKGRALSGTTSRQGRVGVAGAGGRRRGAPPTLSRSAARRPTAGGLAHRARVRPQHRSQGGQGIGVAPAPPAPGDVGADVAAALAVEPGAQLHAGGVAPQDRSHRKLIPDLPARETAPPTTGRAGDGRPGRSAGLTPRTAATGGDGRPPPRGPGGSPAAWVAISLSVPTPAMCASMAAQASARSGPPRRPGRPPAGRPAPRRRRGTTGSPAPPARGRCRRRPRTAGPGASHRRSRETVPPRGRHPRARRTAAAADPVDGRYRAPGDREGARRRLPGGPARRRCPPAQPGRRRARSGDGGRGGRAHRPRPAGGGAGARTAGVGGAGRRRPSRAGRAR